MSEEFEEIETDDEFPSSSHTPSSPWTSTTTLTEDEVWEAELRTTVFIVLVLVVLAIVIRNQLKKQQLGLQKLPLDPSEKDEEEEEVEVWTEESDAVSSGSKEPEPIACK